MAWRRLGDMNTYTFVRRILLLETFKSFIMKITLTFKEIQKKCNDIDLFIIYVGLDPFKLKNGYGDHLEFTLTESEAINFGIIPIDGTYLKSVNEIRLKRINDT